MVAVMATDERQRRGRPKRTLEESAAHSELLRWGHWKGIQCAADGFSPENTISQLLSGRSDVIGHKILCVDMPADVWKINAAVMQLPTDYIAVLLARYALPVEPSTGRSYEIPYLAGLLSVSTTTYRFRLTQAKQAYQRLASAIDSHPEPVL